MYSKFPRRARYSVLAASILLAWQGAHAQSTQPASTEPTLKEVTVTANPLGASDLIAPAQSVSGTGLLLRQNTTLGETLSGLPGVSSTYFGPNASRPIVRGLDGDRIRILNNSGAALDASSLSYDHAVTLDPIAIERVEVLRGPGALLYGGSAVGGVVNVIDNRIPRERIEAATGKVDFGLSSGNSGKNGAFLVEGGAGNVALHADVFARSNDDVSAPIELACSKPGSPASAKKICNSAMSSRGGAVGGSVFFGGGYLGASVASFNSNYGTVAEDEVTIDMKSTRTALEGEFKLGGFIQSLKGAYSHTDYAHTEFEGPDAGTVFKNKGNDWRLEARHAKFGNIEGVWGIQGDIGRFSANGAEAFAPFSKTRQLALFAYEEAGFSWGKLNFGGRFEDMRVESLGNPNVARFVPGSRSFKPASYALGALVNATPAWQFTGNLAFTQRAPKDYELFADGPHIATAAYEIGDINLKREQSTNIDIGTRWKSGAHSAQVSLYLNRFKNYIFLGETGNSRGADGELNPVDADADGVADGGGEDILPEFAYRQVKARFSGIEASGNWRVLDSASKFDLQWRLDTTRAANLDTGAPLPRIAPLRAGLTGVWTQGAWSARLGFDHNAKARDDSTKAYTLWNAALTYRMKAKDAVLNWYARIDNLTDKLAYSASSILTTSAPGKSPLPGRRVKVGLQATF